MRLPVVLLLLSACGIANAADRANAPEAATLYAGATVIDGTGSAPKPRQDILVRGERIVAVGAHGSLAGTAGARSVDLHGRFVIPGLIDTHVHLATPPDLPRARALLRRDLYGGVTAVRDMADDLRPVGELAREARVADIASPDIYYAALMAGPGFFADPRVLAVSAGVKPGTAPWMQAIDDRTDTARAVTLARGTSATAIKVYADLSPELVAAITREAHRQGMQVWAHSAVFPTRPKDVVAAGVDVASHACYQAYEVQPAIPQSYEDHTPVDERLLARDGDDPVLAKLYAQMRERGILLDATGSLFVRYDALRKAHPELKPLRCTGAATIRIVRQAWQAGVGISTGTDDDGEREAAWPSVHDEIFFLVRDVGMSPLQALHSATQVGAQAAAQDADMGTIEAGKLADFVVLAKDPSTDIDNLRSIVATVKRGRDYPRADYRLITQREWGDGD
ncbi:MAG: amidohydrolase family protein [Thermomonas sp.]